MADRWGGKDSDIAGPAANAAAISTGAGDAVLPNAARGIYVGGAGDIKVDLVGPVGSGVTFVAVPAGTILPIRAAKVYQAGTTATNLVALF